MCKLKTSEIVNKARQNSTVVPAFNIPYLPMMQPVVRALRETDSFGLIQVARLEWEKFESKSLKAIRQEYSRQGDTKHTRLHLDHVPVVDEDGLEVDFEAILSEAIELGYESLMVDGSRLELDDNIAATKKAVALAHKAGLPIEAELGAVLGHEFGPMPSYEDIFVSGKGFTDPEQARKFVAETNVDWLSVAIGNIHGAISGAAKSQRKVQARLDIKSLDKICQAVSVPLVLHGGSGITKQCLLDSFKHGIAKINIGTTIRQAYEMGIKESVEKGQKNVYKQVLVLLTDELEVAGQAAMLNPL